MASSNIHIAITKEVNKYLKKDENKLLLGTIAPDASKCIGISKNESHFITDKTNSIPNLDAFNKKYNKYLNDDFVFGYYLHLIVDYLWEKDFLPRFFNGNSVKRLDGQIEECTPDKEAEYVYNDYTGINNDIVEKYNLNFDFFNYDLSNIDNIITEIDNSNIKILINNINELLNKTPKRNNILFNMNDIDKFIETAIKYILNTIEKQHI